jgi:hypothetical protein
MLVPYDRLETRRLALVAARPGGAWCRSVARVRRALVLGLTQARLGALGGPLEFPEVSQRCGPQVGHVRAVQVVAVTVVVASLGQ